MPRHVRDVALVKGDILGLATAPGRVFTAGADGAIRRAALLMYMSPAGVHRMLRFALPLRLQSQ